LRASFASGFLPPGLTQITPLIRVQDRPGSSLALDPNRGNAPIGIPRTDIQGGNPNVEPEESETWSLGLILTPRFAQGLRVSVDYSRIRKKREIFQPTPAFILANEEYLPGRVIRGPKLPGDEEDWLGPVTQIDFSALNLSKAGVDAYDFQLDYQMELAGLGTFHFYSTVTWMESLTRQLTPETLTSDSVGYSDGPLELRGQAGLSWYRGPWSVAWNTQYFDTYSVDFNGPGASESLNEERRIFQGSETIPSQIYHDLSLSFEFADSAPLFLDGVRLTAGVQNIFNSSPPTIAANGINAFDSGAYSQYGDPRLRRYSLSFRKSFGK
jgi:iron complex outermembrane recepter protein